MPYKISNVSINVCFTADFDFYRIRFTHFRIVMVKEQRAPLILLCLIKLSVLHCIYVSSVAPTKFVEKYRQK